MGIFGDKNSPKTSAETSSQTKNTQVQPQTTTGANSTVGGATILSDVSGVSGKIDISTTDQGAVNAGLQTALKALDVTASNAKLGAQTAQGAIDSAVGVATTVAQGQQNTSLKYIVIGVVGLGVVFAAYAYFRSK